MPYCIQCGKELNENAKFCFHCGAGVPNSQPEPQPVPAPVPQPTPPADITVPLPDNPPDPPKQKKDIGKIIVNTLFYTVISAFGLFLVLGFTYPLWEPIAEPLFWKSNAKQYAKREVTDFWQEWDDDMELVSITYDSIKEDEWDEDEIQDYVDKYGSMGISDIDGTHYDTHWDYWEEIGYDPCEETYTVYTIRGDYHVTDNRKQDYEGWYRVTVIHAESKNSWWIDGTEMEMPDELKQYLPD